jgi:cytosine/adenosine deaminase-related metal-dependent hydrolase
VTQTDVKIHRAGWVLPISRPPIRNGAVAVAGDRVTAIGPEDSVLRGAAGAEVRDLGRAILMPGLVNAHTHLSLSALAGRPGDFFGWLGSTALAAAGMSPEEVEAAVSAGLAECRRLGTAVVGEITTRAEGIGALAADPWISARVYVEFLGVSERRARARFEAAVERAEALAGEGGLRPGLSPHAPYSVWPTLWAETAGLCRERGWRWSSHVGEPPDEDRFLIEGGGPVREHLESLGVWDGAFPLPGRSAVGMLAEAGALDGRALLVHGVHLSEADLDRVAASGAFLCVCPRSNEFLGLPPPPVRSAFERGIPLCLGTDSRASNQDLSVWAEMRRVRALWPEAAAEAIVNMATRGGARALGFEDAAGSLEPGKPARMAAVELLERSPADPYEYLVGESIENAISVVAT